MRSSAPPSPAGPSRKSPRGVGLSFSAAEMDLGCRPLPLSPLPARCHPHYAAPTTALAARCPLQPTIKVSACIDLHRPCLLPPSPPSASYCPHRPLLSTTAHYHPLPSLPLPHPPSATHPHPPPPSIGLKSPSLPPPRLPFHLRSPREASPVSRLKSQEEDFHFADNNDNSDNNGRIASRPGRWERRRIRWPPPSHGRPRERDWDLESWLWLQLQSLLQ